MRSKGAMLTKVTSAVPTAFNVVLGSILMLVVDLMAVVLMFLFRLLASPLAAAASIIVFGGFAMLTTRVLKPYSLKYAQRNFELQKESAGSGHPAIEGFRETRIFQRESPFVDRFRVNREEPAGLTRFQLIFNELAKHLLEIVMILGNLLVATLLFLTQDPETAFGLLAVFAAAAMRIIPALNRSVASFYQINSGSPVLRDLAQGIDVLRAQTSAAQPEDGTRISMGPSDAVEVRDVSFRYPDAHEDVLSGITARIPFGGSVALVGGSRAGKTTFVDLLAGLYEPTQGEIRAAGIDIVEHSRAWLSQVAMVSQRVYLWDGTIRELIAFGQRPEEVDERLLADVVGRTRREEVITGLPEGMQTRVGDEGARLSGGQNQRLGIARALYSQASVLILDEATSALDNRPEREITETIERLRGQLSVVVIAHRLSTIRHVDEILFFADGRLRSRGSIAQLVADDPEFAHLVSLSRLEAPEH
ncbi:ABC transporter ATP-binding protein/permease [Kocuria sp. p3-SID1433]|uniref:ABC transporter ATP-binding protein n=1 Tax=unclassified Kocuria TaxID=2649579 RepID=UPI0021A449E1|nr:MULTISPECIES: ABC transporter ATP-binding protein [unclassified Kocuria]MCT1602082.1 ABC transporter ATP-binding protein/permease [Kocuria sp. p3-SID1428]MCT2180365.1 ABC transporter ATP-binding protein/permease [Kocuria sp. p3-SID1433]